MQNAKPHTYGFFLAVNIHGLSKGERHNRNRVSAIPPHYTGRPWELQHNKQPKEV